MRYNEFLTEIRVVYKPEEEHGSYFLIAHRGKIWLFDETKPFPLETRADMEELFDYVLNDDPVEDFKYSDLELENRPDIVIGQLDLEQKELYISGFGTVQSPFTSKMIKDIVNYFKLEDVRVSDLDTVLDTETEYFVSPKEMKGKIPNKLWHGTQLNRLKEILKTGIRPNQPGNWEKIKHNDLIFLTVNPRNAAFHATNSSSEDNPPVILEVKIPDMDQIVWDYDTAIRVYGSLDPTSEKLGYSNISTKLNHIAHDIKLIRNLNPKTDLNTPMGNFGYRGRIPANHIISIRAALQENWEEEGSSDYWTWFDSVEEFKDALEIYNEFGQYFRGIEEEIEELRQELRREEEEYS